MRSYVTLLNIFSEIAHKCCWFMTRNNYHYLHSYVCLQQALYLFNPVEYTHSDLLIIFSKAMYILFLILPRNGHEAGFSFMKPTSLSSPPAILNVSVPLIPYPLTYLVRQKKIHFLRPIDYFQEV